MSKEVLTSYHFPTMRPPEGKDGKWKRAVVRVGKVLPDGRIENTPYRFKRRHVRGGVAMTTNSELVDLPSGDKMNPATGELFVRTKKDTGWWGRKSRTFAPDKYLEGKRRVQE